MRVNFNRQALVDALTSASMFTLRGVNTPLAGVRLEAREDKVVVFATDTERSVVIDVTLAQVERTGAVAVDGSLLLQLIRSEDGETVLCDESGFSMKIRTDAGAYSLPTQDPAKFPPVAAPREGVRSAVVAAASLSRVLRMALVAADEGQTKEGFAMGVLLEVSAGTVTAAGWDGRRLAVGTAAAKAEGDPASVVLPVQTARVLSKVLAEGYATVTLAPTFADVMIDRHTLVSSAVTARNFPPYRIIVAGTPTVTVDADREAVLSVLRRASLFTTPEEQGIALSFASPGLEVRAGHDGSGGTVRLPCKVEGAGIAMSLNAKYLMQGVAAAETSEIKFEFTDAKRAAVVRGGKEFWYAVMPTVKGG
jgi:DNA polymerase III sliding clamp (beta) subunit (PCNA family)